MDKPTTAKHTPGPWSVEDLTEVVARIPSPARSDMDVLTICRATEVDIYVDGRAGTSEANARLISAAPDLLAACETALAVFAGVEYGLGKPGMLQHLPAIQVIKDAIAKAKGETGGAQ